MALVGCMAANPRTLYELSRFDPLNADPADIAVAVKTDRKLHLRQGDVVLRMALDSDDKSRAFDERFVLAITRDTGTANLAGSLKETEHVLRRRRAGDRNAPGPSGQAAAGRRRPAEGIDVATRRSRPTARGRGLHVRR